jgi:DNA-binding response OmpR family regulator
MGAEVTETQGAQEVKDRLGSEPGSFVMVVEDDAALRWMLGQALAKDGFEVLSAENGLEALQLYRENTGKIWLVLADVFMPEMDGLTAAIEMRKIDDDVCFIFMSGYDSERIDRIGIKMGDVPRSEFFRKPFAFRDMTNKIKALEGQCKGVQNAP